MVRQLVLCVLGSFILARVTGQLIVRLKLFSNGAVHRLEFKYNALRQSIASKNLQSDMNYIFKILNCRARALMDESE